MSVDHYNYRVIWSPEDDDYVGLCVELPSLSWLASTPDQAMHGIRDLLTAVIADLPKEM